MAESNYSESSLETVSYVNATVTLILAFGAIFANFVILVIYYKNKDVRNMNNVIVTFLSMCDLIRGVVIMLIKTYNHYTLAANLIEPLCTITAVTSAFTFVFNPLLLALIAVVRYLKIVPWNIPLLSLTFKKIYICLFSLAIIAVVFAILPFFGVGVYAYSNSHGVCFTNWESENREFRIVFYSVVVGVAFPVLTLCYTKLYFVLRQHKTCILANYSSDARTSTTSQQKEKSFKKNESMSRTLLTLFQDKRRQQSCESTSENINVLNYQTTRKAECRCSFSKSSVAKILSEQEYQVSKILIIIFIAYCICWMPAAVVNVIALAKPIRIADVWFYVIVTMVELKTTINPIIYGLGNRSYRKHFRKMFIR